MSNAAGSLMRISLISGGQLLGHVIRFPRQKKSPISLRTGEEMFDQVFAHLPHAPWSAEEACITNCFSRHGANSGRPLIEFPQAFSKPTCRARSMTLG